ncbi:MAG TPA: carboxypeptidase-like regulatory domain-containing protein [Candidatus Bathyarchaeia archaeon]
MKARAPVILLTLLASLIAPVLIGNVYAVICPPGNCQAAVSSNVPSSDGTIWVEVDNNTSNRVPLPQTFNFPYNTTHTVKVLNSTFTGSSTSGHYVWKDWANYYGTNVCPGNQCVWTTNPMLRISSGGPPNGILYNYTGTAGFTAVFDKQYATTLSFTDAKGDPLNPAPAYITLQGQATGTSTVSGYSGQYVTADLYTVTSARWEGADIPTTTTQTLDLTNGPATATISLKAYPATIHVVDNNNSPVSGANVTITFVNGTITTKTYVSDSSGKVNLGDIPYPGSFGLTVRYQNQEYGPYSPDAATNSTYTVQVNAGSSTTTTGTAIVLLVIFGIAFFLILLAIKVRKPAAPPKI